METSGEDELEWRERVQRAKRQIGEQQRRANLPLWRHILLQILKTSSQFVVLCLVLLMLFYWLRSLPHPIGSP